MHADGRRARWRSRSRSTSSSPVRSSAPASRRSSSPLRSASSRPSSPRRPSRPTEIIPPSSSSSPQHSDREGVLLVGHNPNLHQFIAKLISNGNGNGERAQSPARRRQHPPAQRRHRPHRSGQASGAAAVADRPAPGHASFTPASQRAPGQRPRGSNRLLCAATRAPVPHQSVPAPTPATPA